MSNNTAHIITPIEGASNNLDYSTIFNNALINNRRVFVSGGTYRLSMPIAIFENCELELAQDVVLNFTQNSGNCITINRSGSLKGNHATVKVPYVFDGNVIFVSTKFDKDLNDFSQPNSVVQNEFKDLFIKADPQWKSARYITDLNIAKETVDGGSGADGGFYCSMDGTCYGTAVYINAHNADISENDTRFSWGLHFSGLRIAGAFEYGIKGVNEDGGWTNDMNIEALIEGCKIGAYFKECSNSYLSLIVQPKCSRIKDEEKSTEKQAVYVPYATCGIWLENCTNVDMTRSRVWDWNESRTLVKQYDEEKEAYINQHLVLIGNCSGLIMYDHGLGNSSVSLEEKSFANDTEAINYTNPKSFWDSIYYDNPVSMLSATIFGAKGRIPIDPKYAFYKNYRSGKGVFNENNLTWRDYHNMVRYDVPVAMLNPSINGNANHLYKIGSFTTNVDVENPDTLTPDPLNCETITIEENNEFGLIGWSNIHFDGDRLNHYWNPLSAVYKNRVPIYFYSEEGVKDETGEYIGVTYTIYRLIKDTHDIQHWYNCKVSITNARRFIFDFVDMGEIDFLNTVKDPSEITDFEVPTYICMQPMVVDSLQSVTNPQIKGIFSLVNGIPVVCTKSAEFSDKGRVSSAAEVRSLVTTDKIDSVCADWVHRYFIDGTMRDFFENKIGTYTEDKTLNISNGLTHTLYGSIVTDMLEVSGGDIIRIEGIDYDIFTKLVWYDKNSDTLKRVGGTGVFSVNGERTTDVGTFSYDYEKKILTWSNIDSEIANDCTFKLSAKVADGYTPDSVILTINEEILRGPEAILRPTVTLRKESLPDFYSKEEVDAMFSELEARLTGQTISE